MKLSKSSFLAFSLYATAFLLPLFPKILPYVIALLFLAWLLYSNPVDSLRDFFRNKYAILFCSFYMVFVFGMFYTSNLSNGLAQLQIKFSLLLFPLIFSTLDFNKFKVDKVLQSFVFGCAFALLICFISATYFYFSSGVNKFFYADFSLFLHPGYFSMYLNLALCYIFFSGGREKKIVLKDYLMAITFIAGLLILSSKIGTIVLVVLLICYLFYLFFISKAFQKGFIYTFSLIVFTVFFYDLLINKSTVRFGKLTENISKTPEKATHESTGLRKLIWEEAAQLIKENPLLGVGTGDVRDELIARYTESEMDFASDRKLNSHNEFIEITIALGTVGLLVFVASFFFPLLYAIRQRAYLYLFFVMIILINCLTESIFEKQTGIVFFAFFNSLIFFSFYKINNKHDSILTSPN
jgi:O-antigen ligase